MAVQAALPIFLGFLSIPLTEPPAWHVFQGRIDEAHRLLIRLRNNKTDIVDNEITMFQRAKADEGSRRGETRFWDILKGTNLQRAITSGAPSRRGPSRCRKRSRR